MNHNFLIRLVTIFRWQDLKRKANEIVPKLPVMIKKNNCTCQITAIKVALKYEIIITIKKQKQVNNQVRAGLVYVQTK